jgi:hypothetical protein
MKLGLRPVRYSVGSQVCDVRASMREIMRKDCHSREISYLSDEKRENYMESA